MERRHGAWGPRIVPEWEYRKIDLNQHRPQVDELDMLNAAGADGWELVGITSNNIAYLKRELEKPAPAAREDPATTNAAAGPAGGNDRPKAQQEGTAKYRDPATNETWSGRGRMPNWLKRKQEAGEDIEEYLI